MSFETFRNKSNASQETDRVSSIENERSFEAIRRGVKTAFRYGMVALVAVKSFTEFERATLPQYDISDDHSEYKESLLHEPIKDEREDEKILYLDNQYNDGTFVYYDPKILDSYDEFLKYALHDKEFLDPGDVANARYLHSRERLLALIQERDGLAKEKSSSRKFLDQQILDFELIEDGDEDAVIKKALSYKYLRMKEHLKDIESQHEWLKTIISSESYLARLEHEVGDQEKARAIQKERLDRLAQEPYYLSNHTHYSMPGAYGHVYGHGDNKYDAFFRNEGFDYQTSNQADGTIESHRESKTPLHEFDHQTLMDLMTDTAKKIYDEEFSKDSLTPYQLKKVSYYRNPLELAARKRVLDYQLEKYGVKKYDEEFTEEHYQQLEQLFNEKKLDSNAEEFFRSYKKESLMLIMNSVAEHIDSPELNPQEGVA